MTAVRTLFARVFGPSAASRTATAAAKPRRHRQSCRARLEIEDLEERTLLSGNGLTGQYFDNNNFTNLKVTRTDSSINFNWGNNHGPAANVAATEYSVRWTGFVQPLYSQAYTFYTRSDDGVRLWVDGQLIVNNWSRHSATENSGGIRLVAGQKYSIKMEYFQGTGDAVAQLSWSSASQAKQVIPPSQLYTNLPAPVANPGPSARLSAGNVTSGGAATSTFSVTYSDRDGINAATIKTGNVRVTGPNGFNQLATLVSVAGSWGTRTATYRLAAPGGKWDANDNGAYAVSLQWGQVKDGRGNYANGATIGSFTVAVPGTDWFTTNLHDAGVRNLVKKLDADRSLSRNDVLAVFRAVESNGVSASEFIDLQTVARSGNYLGISDAVRDLAGKVVYGDTANAQYQGHGLGNLHAGSSGGQLEQLVGKWFLGHDHPMAIGNTSYVVAAGSLFGSGPSYADVKQGTVGDCYFLAGLAVEAFRTPSSIRSMFTDNGDGTFAVRFFHNGKPTYVTVDRTVPTDRSGHYVYANFQASVGNPANKLWVALAEKAYAQLASSGWSRYGSTANSYSAIESGWEGDAVVHTTGRTESYQGIVGSLAGFNAIVSAFQAGKLVTLDTKPTTQPAIVPNHVYVMVGYNAAAHTLNLYNPWGRPQQLSWGQVAGNFQGWSKT